MEAIAVVIILLICAIKPVLSTSIIEREYHPAGPHAERLTQLNANSVENDNTTKNSSS